MIDCLVLVQARMSSRRFPGKVLAPLCGRPVIAHVLERVAEVVGRQRVILLTSEHASDDPLASYVATNLDMTVFRGSLDDVMARFQGCLRAHPCKWFVRISGDSPAIDSGLLTWMLARVTDDLDLLSNVVRRTFPPGLSIEVVRSRTMLDLCSADLAADEREHVTPHFYRHPDRFRIRNVSNGAEVGASVAVDTLEDLESVERLLSGDPAAARGYARYASLDPLQS